MPDPQFLCRPKPAHEQLLDILCEGDESAVRSWLKWRSAVDIDYLEPGVFELLPLLYKRLRHLIPDDPWMGRLKGVYKRTWTNNITFYREACRAMDVFRAGGVDSMLIKGMGLLPYYDNDPGLRTMADVDVLIRSSDSASAIDLLLKSGWQPNPASSQRQMMSRIVPRQHAWSFLRGDLGLDLHWFPIHREWGAYDTDALWRDAGDRVLLGYTIRVPGIEDMLLLTLIHGLRPQNNRCLQWAMDVMRILESGMNQTQQDGFIRRVRERRFDALAADSLGYLAWHYSIPVPLERGRSDRSTASRLQNLEYRDLIDTRGSRSLSRRGARVILSTLRNGTGKTFARQIGLGAGSLGRWLREAVARITGHLLWLLNRNTGVAQALRRINPRFLMPAPPDWPVAELVPGDTAAFTKTGPGHRYAISGWALQEAEHLWSDGHQARLLFALNPTVQGHIRVELGFHPYFAPSRETVQIDLAIGGQWCDRLTVTRSPAPSRHGFFVHTATLEPESVVDIILIPLHPGRPSRDQDGNDPRLLGVCFSSLGVALMPRWDPANEVKFESGDAAGRYLGMGWWSPEKTGVWTSMIRARLRIPLAEKHHRMEDLLFRFTPCLPGASTNRLAVTVTGKYAGHQCTDMYDHSMQECHVSLQGDCLELDYIDLLLETEHLFSPSAADQRKLGIMLHKITATGQSPA